MVRRKVSVWDFHSFNKPDTAVLNSGARAAADSGSSADEPDGTDSDFDREQALERPDGQGQRAK